MPTRTAGIGNSVSGTITGASVQSGSIQGGVHVHVGREESAVPVPRQLPASPARFTGRESELRLLESIVLAADRARPVVVVLSGPGGVGKTALSLELSSRVSSRFRDGQLFVDLHGFSDDEATDPGEALGLFLRALGVPAEKVPANLAEQTALYRSVTARKALLVVLDNALSAAQARVLVPSSPDSLVVISSRSRLTGLIGDGAHQVEIGPLPGESAFELLSNTVGEARVAGDRVGAEDLVALCGGLPIAVRVAASRLLVRSHWSVRRVRDELADEQSRLANLSAGVEMSVQATFDLSYRMLEPRAAVLYRRLGLHPSGEFSADVAAAVLEGSGADSDVLLESLLEASLVEERSEDRYAFHDLLRLHARHRLEVDDTPEERLAAVRRIVEWYLATAMRADAVLTPYRRRLPYDFSGHLVRVRSFEERDSALAWLEHERVNLLAAGRLALDHGLAELAWRMCDVLWPLFLLRKHYRDRLEVDQRGVEAARLWGNEFAEADMLKRWGLALKTARRFGEAEQRFRSSMAVWERIGDRRGMCDAREGLALVYQSTGRLQEARAEFENLLSDNEDLGNRRAVGLSSINLGSVLLELDRAPEALPHLRRAEAVFDEPGTADPYNRARATTALASALCSTGELVAAADAAEAGMAAMTALGSAYGRADAQVVLAELARATGQIARSRAHLEAAVEVFESLGSPRVELVRQRLSEISRSSDDG